jgi:hypothetical protein
MSETRTSLTVGLSALIGLAIDAKLPARRNRR